MFVYIFPDLQLTYDRRIPALREFQRCTIFISKGMVVGEIVVFPQKESVFRVLDGAMYEKEAGPKFHLLLEQLYIR